MGIRDHVLGRPHPRPGRIRNFWQSRGFNNHVCSAFLLNKNLHLLCLKNISNTILLQNRTLESCYDHSHTVVAGVSISSFCPLSTAATDCGLAAPRYPVMDEAASSTLGKAPLQIAQVVFSEPQTKSTLTAAAPNLSNKCHRQPTECVFLQWVGDLPFSRESGERSRP